MKSQNERQEVFIWNHRFTVVPGFSNVICPRRPLELWNVGKQPTARPLDLALSGYGCIVQESPYGMVIMPTGTGGQLTGFEYQLCYFLVVWSWENYSTCLSLLSCKIGIFILPTSPHKVVLACYVFTSWGLKIKRINPGKELGTVLGERMTLMERLLSATCLLTLRYHFPYKISFSFSWKSVF